MKEDLYETCYTIWSNLTRIDQKKQRIFSVSAHFWSAKRIRSLESLKKGWLFKEARCLGAIWINATKSNHFWSRSLGPMKNRLNTWSKFSDSPQTTSNPGLATKKVMFGGIGWELSIMSCYNVTKLTSRYFERSNQERAPDLANKKVVVFHHDNSRPHSR